MWIFTNKGFISMVENRDDKSTLMVRARNKEHLEAIFPGAVIDKTPSADYMFRTVVNKERAAQVIAGNVFSVDYDNFKNSIEEDEYHMACSGVWHVLYQYQRAIIPSPKKKVA